MSLIIAGGLFLTVFLLVVYVPLFMKRNERLRIHLRNLDLATKADIENWYAVNHLEKDMGASVNDIVAYTLPIATGIMVNILSASLK